MTTYPVPSGRTARRLEWPHLPPHVRAYVERRCGSPVVRGRVAGRRLHARASPRCSPARTARRHFVKAASVKAQRMFADSYREEARKLAALPADVAAPAAAVAARRRLGGARAGVRRGAPPRAGRGGRPTSTACLDVLEEVAGALTPAPAELGLDAFADELADWPAYWDHVRATRPDLPHLEEAAALAAGFAEVAGGDTLVHTDVRDDNMLHRHRRAGAVLRLELAGRSGAAWLDTLFLLIGPRGDGLDVEARARRAAAAARRAGRARRHRAGAGRRLLPEVSRRPGAADLAVHPRAQRWQGEVCWDWLCERRGWR